MDAKKPRILVVDDEPGIRQLVGRYLQGLGVEVLAAGSVAEARAILQREKVQVALIDKNMPGESGLDLLHDIKARQLKVAPVMMTAYDEAEARADAKALGVAAYLTKPFRFAELEAALKLAIGREL